MELTTFNALAEPSRFRIVNLLQKGPLTVGEIAERLDIRQPQASKHLKVLLDAGLVEVRADANRRNYMLRSEPFQELTVGSIITAAYGTNGLTTWMITWRSCSRI